jgi:hypothetical protein
MKKLLIVGGAVTGAALLAKRFASSSGGPDFSIPRGGRVARGHILER